MGVFDRVNQSKEKKNRFANSNFSFGTDKYDTSSVERSIGNAETRIKSSGYKPKEDKRNWFEKSTNLPEGQNFFFDTLEILDRPGNAIRTAIDQKDNVGEDLWEGFSGKEHTRGTDILDDLNLETDNKYANIVSGFGAELVTDPTMLIPVGAVAKGIGKGAKATNNFTKGAYNTIATDSIKETIDPIAKSTKDTLGYMFNTKYGRDMQFDESGMLKKGEDKITPAMQEADNNIRYQNMKNTENILNTAKKTGGYDKGDEVGRIMESELEQFDDAGNLIERSKKPSPDSPELDQAAAELMRSNEVLRNQAKNLDIEIPELKGYMRHVLSEAEKKRRKTQGKSVYDVDKGNFGVGNPNDKFLKNRKLTGSAEEINEKMGRDFFEPNAFFSTAHGQKQLTEYMYAVDFRRKILSDRSLAIPYEKGMSIPEGAHKINTKNYSFMTDADKSAMGLKDEVGGEYIVTTAVKNSLDKYQHMTTDEGVKGFLKAFDKAQSTWKRAALFSIPYHLRNDVGAKFNNYVGGMNTLDLAKFSTVADQEVFNGMVRGNQTEMYDEYLRQGLGAGSQSQVEFAKYGEDASKKLKKQVEEGSKGVGGKLKDKANPLRAFETSREFGDFIDQTNRYSLYKWAREKKGMNPEQAAAKVRQVQFDYTDLTTFERDFMTRAVPFYRWMRNNIPYQIKQFAHDPRQYIKVDTLRQNAQSAVGIDEENVPDWMKESFAIPVTGEDGSGKFLSTNLPLSDLTKASQPGKTFVDSLSPLAKMPVELTMNRNFFYDKPIEQYEGQESQFRVPYTDMEFGIPKKPAYALENLTGQIGNQLSDYLQKPESVNQDTKFRTPSLGISTMVKDFDAAKSEYYQKLEELQRLRDRIDYIEQQTGTRPPTVDEINKRLGQ